LLVLLGDLTFMGPCIVSIFQYTCISNNMQSYTVHLYLETALHVSGGTSTHHQERIQLHLQHLEFVTPLLLSAAIVEEMELVWVCCGWRRGIALLRLCTGRTAHRGSRVIALLRLCTGRTTHRESRGIALLFHDHGTGRVWGVSVTPWPFFTPGKDPVPIVQEAAWVPGPVWTGAENILRPETCTNFSAWPCMLYVPPNAVH
jgi:hypothetical protein